MSLDEQDWRPITFQGVTFPATLMGISILEPVLGITDEELGGWLWRLPICKGVAKSAPAEKCAQCAQQVVDLMLEHREQVLEGIRDRLAPYGFDPEVTYRDLIAALQRIVELSRAVNGDCVWSAPAHPNDQFQTRDDVQRLQEARQKARADLNHQQGVKAAIHVLLTTTADADGDPTVVGEILRDRLAGDGFSNDFCEELATFVPLAFSRALLGHLQIIDFPSHYVEAFTNSTAEAQHLLSDNALYNTARAEAAEWESDEEKKRIASFSGEYCALMNLLNDAEARGTTLKQAAVTPPYVVYTRHTTEPDRPVQKPWWRFW
jgi:hypothetical protein